MPRSLSRALRTVLPVLVATSGFLSARALAAQEDDAGWEVSIEVGGTVLFGNRDQSIFATRTEVAYEGSWAESTTDLRFTYGESTDSDGVTEVNRRSWLADTALDFRPDALWRPYVTARAEAALERRIDRRYQGGIGIKYDNRIDRDNRTEFSIGILAERTRRISSSSSTGNDLSSLGRFSAELRVRRTYFTDRLAVDVQNAYRPVFDAPGNFVFTSRNSLTFSLTEVFGIRFTHESNYDSGAKDRGAETNHDGEFQFAIVAEF